VKKHLFSLENIYRAYRQCRRRKRNTYNALIFEQNLEENLLDLHEALKSGRYTPKSSLAFLVEKPKRREIFAADFQDRVVHHLLVSHLEPQWERRFIHDSYACRQGKGTHKAVERLRAFTRKVTGNGTRRAWYLQLDVRGFFIMLNRRILFERLATYESDPTVLWLIQVILSNKPTQNCRLRDACRGDFESLPPHKTLFKAAPDCGLPIGNLTSQFFANVYLDALDQFVKHQLKAHYYVRYCDDLVLLSAMQQELERWEEQMSTFLNENLQLQLNDRRKLQPLSDGIDFLGYIVRPEYLLVRRRVIGNLREKLQRAEQTLYNSGMKTYEKGRTVYPYPWPLLTRIYQWLNAYLSHFNKASTHRLVQALRKRFNWLDEYFCWCEKIKIPLRKGKTEKALRKEKKIKRWISKVVYRYPIPRYAQRFAQQTMWFRVRLPGHVLMIQVGQFWEISFSSGCSHRFPQRLMTEIKPLLWESGLPVAWIEETGRQISGILERTLMCRWSSTDFVGGYSHLTPSGLIHQPQIHNPLV
jgi:RNA-directed DNA polymerase